MSGGSSESEGKVKVIDLRALLALVTHLPDERLRELADARYWMEPRDHTERMILFVAAGQQQWREECQVQR